jgi:hypothetical protein
MIINYYDHFDHYTVKKAFRYSCPQPGCHVTKLSWAGIIYI